MPHGFSKIVPPQYKTFQPPYENRQSYTTHLSKEETQDAIPEQASSPLPLKPKQPLRKYLKAVEKEGHCKITPAQLAEANGISKHPDGYHTKDFRKKQKELGGKLMLPGFCAPHQDQTSIHRFAALKSVVNSVQIELNCTKLLSPDDKQNLLDFHDLAENMGVDPKFRCKKSPREMEIDTHLIQAPEDPSTLKKGTIVEIPFTHVEGYYFEKLRGKIDGEIILPPGEKCEKFYRVILQGGRHLLTSYPSSIHSISFETIVYISHSALFQSGNPRVKEYESRDVVDEIGRTFREKYYSTQSPDIFSALKTPPQKFAIDQQEWERLTRKLPLPSFQEGDRVIFKQITLDNHFYESYKNSSNRFLVPTPLNSGNVYNFKEEVSGMIVGFDEKTGQPLVELDASTLGFYEKIPGLHLGNVDLQEREEDLSHEVKIKSKVVIPADLVNLTPVKKQEFANGQEVYIRHTIVQGKIASQIPATVIGFDPVTGNYQVKTTTNTVVEKGIISDLLLPEGKIIEVKMNSKSRYSLGENKALYHGEGLWIPPFKPGQKVVVKGEMIAIKPAEVKNQKNDFKPSNPISLMLLPLLLVGGCASVEIEIADNIQFHGTILSINEDETYTVSLEPDDRKIEKDGEEYEIVKNQGPFLRISKKQLVLDPNPLPPPPPSVAEKTKKVVYEKGIKPGATAVYERGAQYLGRPFASGMTKGYNATIHGFATIYEGLKSIPESIKIEKDE